MRRWLTGYNTVNDRLLFFLGVSSHVINSFADDYNMAKPKDIERSEDL